ncbi:MAG: radical SAM protein [Candidatus Omnitrophica bacterium]|nr:radical SAM protein [Candidatus Omnitrophota bacterium]MDD5653759.1 radical SAM protein [Candidatus Omnitrophota bacterium]
MIKNMLFSRAYPSYMIFFVTAKCNMKCQHCFYWQEINSLNPELDLGEIGKISHSLPNLFFLRITGGEPFLRGDLEEIVGCFYRNSSVRRVGISTNGSLNERTVKFANDIAGRFPGLQIEIGISIDHLYEKHDAIRCSPGAFKNAMGTYDNLLAVKKKYPNLTLGFLVTLMKDNQDSLEDIFKYLQEKKPDGIGLNIIRGKPKDAAQIEVDIGKYDKFRHLLNQYNFASPSKRSFMQRLRIAKTILSQDAIISMVKNNRAQLECLAGERIAVLYPDGNVCACELLGDRIGNIRDYGYDFKKLWKAESRKKITQNIRGNKCFCTHECFITADLIFSLKGMLKVFFKTLFNRHKKN